MVVRTGICMSYCLLLFMATQPHRMGPSTTCSTKFNRRKNMTDVCHGQWYQKRITRLMIKRFVPDISRKGSSAQGNLANSKGS
ncbi:hypothetical protein Lal_00021379 [Lupinus albus]|nr:hypothetical protein Lal_00021379 [Lupinus albus]